MLLKFWLDQNDSQTECKHDTHDDKQGGKYTENTFLRKFIRRQLTNVSGDQCHKNAYHNALQRSAYENSVYVLNLDNSFDDKRDDAKDESEFPGIKKHFTFCWSLGWGIWRSKIRTWLRL